MTKAYVVTTAILFGALTVLHIWRIAVEPGARTPELFFLILLTAVFTAWGARVWSRLTAANS